MSERVRERISAAGVRKNSAAEIFLSSIFSLLNRHRFSDDSGSGFRDERYRTRPFFLSVRHREITFGLIFDFIK
jgi:hypothetical protein